MKSRASASDFKSLRLTLAMANGDDDDDFQNPSQAFAIAQNLVFSSLKSPNYQQPLKPSNGAPPPRKKQKHSVSSGKENRRGNQVPKSNDSRVSNVCSKGKGVKVERGNLSGTIGSGAVAITKFDERSGVDESCGLTPESNLVVNLQNGDSKAVGEESSQFLGSIVSGAVVIQSTPVSDSCFLSTCDQTKSCSVEPIEGDVAKEEKSRLLPSGDSNIVKICQNGEFGIEDFNVHGVISNLKAEEKSLYLMSIESRLLESKSKLSELNVGNGCGDFELGTQEKTLKVMRNLEIQAFDFKNSGGCEDNVCLNAGKGSYYSMSIESRLLESRVKCDSSNAGDCCGDFEPGTPLNVLMDLCCETGADGNSFGDESFGLEGDGLVECPLCGTDITHLSEELRQVHTNGCLDKDATMEAAIPAGEIKSGSRQEVVDVNPVLEWLRTLGLSRYEAAFVKEEVDWETLQWLTEEDLLNMGVVALGPRKKIVHALSELRQKKNCGQPGEGTEKDNSIITTNENTKTLVPGNKLITEYFQGPAIGKNRPCSRNITRHGIEKTSKDSLRRRVGPRSHVSRGKVRDIPPWCCIPGTPFRVDAFRFLRGDCSHWFLTHFHMDHYQGLTKSFCHGKIYCSSITAQLVNMKIGVPWERLQILPLNQKITVAGVNLTCLDANHCPGSIIILFEPPNGKAVLHTGDFRFSAELAASSVLQSCHVHTLILDTTYCNPQYDFPKQEAVIQFVIEAIQVEAFNPKTLFLIGTYTIGKERLFLEVARLLKKKIYVGAAKLRLLRCLELPEEDMQWFTANEMESHIHVVPMWTIASFKRMKHISNQYSGRFNLIVAFSPTGWTFGKGKKKTPGRRWQQGTIIRYEVPYSEHCSFTELREFVQFISPENIIPSVNNEGSESVDAMITLLTSDPQN